MFVFQYSTYLCDGNLDQILKGTTYNFGSNFQVCGAPQPPGDIDYGKNNENNKVGEYSNTKV